MGHQALERTGRNALFARAPTLRHPTRRDHAAVPAACPALWRRVPVFPLLCCAEEGDQGTQVSRSVVGDVDRHYVRDLLDNATAFKSGNSEWRI
jgi:hypothetical protein